VGQEKDLLKKFGLYGDSMLKKRTPVNSEAASHMTSPSYLRQSSVLINEALKSGFDVLQLSNGDIVTTGTKTIVTKYTWDSAKGKLIKHKSEPVSTRKAKAAPALRAQERATEDA